MFFTYVTRELRRRRPQTLVAVTHDSSIAARAPRRAWIAQGRLGAERSSGLITASGEA